MLSSFYILTFQKGDFRATWKTQFLTKVEGCHLQIEKSTWKNRPQNGGHFGPPGGGLRPKIDPFLTPFLTSFLALFAHFPGLFGVRTWKTVQKRWHKIDPNDQNLLFNSRLFLIPKWHFLTPLKSEVSKKPPENNREGPKMGQKRVQKWPQKVTKMAKIDPFLTPFLYPTFQKSPRK